jgi:hypothetical protein
MMQRPDNSLDRLLDDLPREATPQRNLWPGIAAAIGNKPRRSRSWFMAVTSAAAAAACLATLFTWAFLQRNSVPRVIQAATGQGAFDEPRDPRFVLARNSLQKTYTERLALLKPETRAKIEASLAEIRKAHEDIRQALIADPQSVALEQMLQSTWHDEFDLYESVVQATQPTLSRI